MRRRIILSIGAFITAIASMLMLAGPANAVQTNSIVVCGYGPYNGAIDFNRSHGNATFSWWTITTGASALPMEYRVRWIAPDGVTVLYDTGYVASYNGNPGGNPGVTRYLKGTVSRVVINVGKAGDGCATGAMSFNIRV